MIKADVLINALESTGDYRVFKRVTAPTPTPAEPGEQEFAGIYLDVETTGLSHEHDEIIQFAMIPFSFTNTGKITAVHAMINELQEPKQPITPEITRLTGITNEDVQGKTINRNLISGMAKGADLVIAHNAGFDRPFVEALIPEFESIPWACSQLDVPWRDEGFDKTNLESLTFAQNKFYEKHRADVDVLAGLSILNQELPISGRNALAVLIEHMRLVTCKVTAANAPFEAKDALKARKYRWNPNNQPNSPKGWWTTLPETALRDELSWLATNVYSGPVNLPVTRITALERYSNRAV